MKSLIRFIPTLVVILAVLAGSLTFYRMGYNAADTAWQAKNAKALAEARQQLADAQLKARETEQRLQTEIETVKDDAHEQIEIAKADAAAANAAADRLRNQAQRYAAAADRAAERADTAEGGATAGPSAAVLADLLGRIDARAGELAAIADASRVAGLTCQQAYAVVAKR